MNPLSALFGAVVAVRNALYDRGRLRAQRLHGPVISVGNLSTGGAGKTPFVIALGELLGARAIEFDVLTRGYGRSSRGAAQVDPGGSARQFGDEPLLITRRLGVPVFVGEVRYEAGLLAERLLGPRLHILDDGFQHRQLARDFDIVLVTPDDAHDRLLPVGRLRESLCALRRADAIVLTPGASLDGLPVTGKPIWQVRRGICPQPVPPRPVAFCGIARPRRFFSQLREAGIQPVAEIGFRDHHAYTPEDIAALLERKQQSGAEGFVTTEKDAINLGGLADALQPLAIVPATMELLEATAAIDAMLTVIAGRQGFKVSRFQGFKVGE
jgi:tetraacyldisaccharide 4'-kinase